MDRRAKSALLDGIVLKATEFLEFVKSVIVAKTEMKNVKMVQANARSVFLN